MVHLQKKYLITLIATAVLFCLSIGCKPPLIVTQVKPSISVPKIEEVPHGMPVDSASTIYAGLKHPLMVFRFYKTHAFELVWLRDSVSVLADSMKCFIGNIRFNGLLPQDYHYEELSAMPFWLPDHGQRCRKEALLTDAFLTVVQDLKYGRIDTRTDQETIDTLTQVILDKALAAKKIKELLEAQEPRHTQYQQLKKALGEILNNVDSSDRRSLLSGATNDSVAMHRKLQLLEVNMERWRSEQIEFGDRFIWINIPAYQLRVIEGERNILESRVIVGKTDTPTPTLSSSVESISLYPYWNVPRKISVEELLPAIQQDTSYLRRNNFDVLDKNGAIRDPATLEWKKFNKDYFPFSLRQREGNRNSLGIIKFVFDNPYAVFLHDTNAKGLFQKNVRALSHGCVRMEKAKELAKYLVYDPVTIEKGIEMKKQTIIGLHRPVPIYIRYITCEVINFELKCYDDVYGLDHQMIMQLYHPERANSQRQRDVGMSTR